MQIINQMITQQIKTKLKTKQTKPAEIPENVIYYDNLDLSVAKGNFILTLHIVTFRKF